MIFLMKWGSVGQSSLPARAKARDLASWNTDSRLKHFDSGFRVLASGFRFPVSGFRDPGSGIRVPGSGFWVPIMVVHGCSEFIVNRSSSGFTGSKANCVVHAGSWFNTVFNELFVQHVGFFILGSWFRFKTVIFRKKCKDLRPKVRQLN